MAEVSRPHFDALPAVTRTRLGIGLGSGLKYALTLVDTTRDRTVLMGLAERFPQSHELHVKVLRHPAAFNDQEVLSTIEHSCREAIVRLPFVRDLMKKAKNTQDMDQLAGFVLSPLKVVRMASCLNSSVTELMETAHRDEVREAIRENKRLFAGELERGFLRHVMPESGERPISPAPAAAVKPPVAVRTPPAPTVTRQPTPSTFVDLDALEGGVRAISWPRRPQRPGPGGAKRG